MGTGWRGTVFVVTGGTGTLGTALVKFLLDEGAKVRAYARNEHGHERLERQIPLHQRDRLSNLIGDVKDLNRLKRASQRADYLVHAAAQKIIPLAEYNPRECLETNISGTENVVEATLDCGIKKAVFISTDKASAPSTLYGASKLAAERVWLAANRYCGAWGGHFVAVRYGNVWGSQGSVVHEFMRQKKTGILKITDRRMTRFHIRIEEAIRLILTALTTAHPGELLIPKLPAYFVTDLAEAVASEAKIEFTGRRPGEKLSESLISNNESCYASEKEHHYVLTPGIVQQEGEWEYTSSTTPRKLSREALRSEVESLYASEEALSHA